MQIPSAQLPIPVRRLKKNGTEKRFRLTNLKLIYYEKIG